MKCNHESLHIEALAIHIDGFTYWRVADRFYQDDGRIRWNNMIMSFDTKSTEFAEIYLPGSLSNYDEIVLKISMLRESLVVLECNRMAVNQVYGVWMMENGDPKSFTKLYTIDSPYGSSIRQVHGFSKSGKPIIVMKKDRSKPNALSVYEPNSKDINHIGISAKQTISFAISYTETLHLLNH
ncbi:putative F-box domain-containing protein [Tanacetum coccineum]